MTSDRVEISTSGKRWLGAGMLLLGALGAGIPWLVLSGERADYDAAAREQSFRRATCTVTRSRILDVPVKDGTEHTLQVDFSLQTEDSVVDGLSYTYAPHASPGGLLPPGRQVPCFHDPADPYSTVLIQKGAPRGDRPGIGFLHLFFTALGLLTLAFGVHVLRTQRKLYLGGIPD